MNNIEHLNFATAIALMLWPLVAVWLYATLPLSRATIWTILGGFLLLPVHAAIHFSGIPAFTKESVPNLAAYIGCTIVLRRPVRMFRSFGLAELMILIFFVSLFVTSGRNEDAVASGNVLLPGISAYDAFSTIAYSFISLIPFFLGREILRDETSIEEILRTLILAGLAYTPLMLFEIRMSPQLHAWIYGYFPGFYPETVRYGGFRPVVFFPNAIRTAFFLMTATVAAAAFWRARRPTLVRTRVPAAAVTGYLSVVLVLCKTLSGLIYGAFAIFLVHLTKPKLQMKIAVALTCFALFYPTLRAADLVPTNTLLKVAGLVNKDRRASLNDRFRVEDALLKKASQRFWFGWGKWGRSLIYDQYGNQQTQADGFWIIVMGEFGYIGFITTFGLLALSVFRAASALRFISSPSERILFAALTLILAINIVDLVPNASLSPWSWLIVGALFGRAESLFGSARQQKRRGEQSKVFRRQAPANSAVARAKT